MKKLLAFLLALVMVFMFVGCGGGDAAAPAADDAAAAEETAAPAEEAEAPEEPAEPEVQEVTIGDYHVVYESAILYKPFESDMNPAVVLVYFSFTNNSSEAYLPYTRVFTPAEQNGETLKGVWFTGDECPVEALNYEEIECPAGETVRCCVMYNFTEGAGNVDVTFMDTAHEIEDQMVVSIDPASLELVTTPLGTPE